METSKIEEMFLSADKFFHIVDELVWRDDISYIEATIKTCSELKIDIEDINKLKLVNPILKDHLKMDATNDGYLKKEAQLPI